MTHCLGAIFALALTFISNANCVIIVNGVNMGQTYISAPYIQIANGVIQCGTITCPPNSYQCSVVQQSYDNNAYVQMTSTCTDANGGVTYSAVADNENPYPGNPVKTYSQANTNGNTLNCDSCLTAAEAQAKVDETVKKALSRASRVYNSAMENAGRVYNNAMENADRVVQQTQGLGDRIRNQVYNELRQAGI